MPKSNSQVEKSTNQTSLFISMALDMSWRLAIVILVPIIGGFKLDKAWDMTPVLTITGFVIAMTGFGLVMWDTARKADKATGQAKENKT